ncbi:MAG: clan AA aspartic protease [Thermoproteus sp.]|nr:clan AA aspartic protease [Thermoproteus sp.]
MGLTFVDIEINGRRYRALVDTGYNGRLLVNEEVAREAQLPRVGEGERALADGRRIKTWISYARVKLMGEEGIAMIEVIEGLPVDALVGAITLEELGFIVNPRTGAIERAGLLAV